MKRQITFRLITLILTATLLLTSTGLMTLLAQAAETETLVNQGLSESVTEDYTEKYKETETETATAPERDTTTESTTQPTAEPTTQAATEPTTQAPTKPSNDKPQTPKPSTATVAVEGGSLTPSGPELEAEGFTPSRTQPQGVTWVGVDGTTNNMGKASNPYAVPDLNHFLEIQGLINDTSSADKYFRLTDHIDLSTITNNDLKSLAGFEGALLTINPALAISDPNKACLKLDGDGYEIIGFNLNNNFATNFGLFGHLGANSVLENIVFDDCAITVSYQNTTSAAVVVVQNMGTLRNLTFIGDTETVTLNMGATAGTGTNNEEATLVGGHKLKYGFAVLVADNQGTIENCDLTDISITARHRNFVGGVAGQNSGTIKQINGSQTIPYGVNGFTFEAVSHSGSSPIKEVGAIAGRNNAAGTIEDCTVNLPGSTGTNGFKLGTNVGGIVGVNKGEVEQCLVKGKNLDATTLTSSNFDFRLEDGSMGGIVGLNEGNVDLSSALEIGAYISINSNVNFGGIAGTSNGQTAGMGQITNSFASGRQLGTFPSTLYFVGGIVGRVQGLAFLENNYALFSVSKDLAGGGSGNSRGGGIAGGGAKITSFSTSKPNFWSPNVSNMPSHAGDFGADSHTLKRSVRVMNLKTSESAITVSKNDFEHSWGSSTVEIPSLKSSNSVFSLEYLKEANAILMSETTSALSFGTTATAGAIALLKYDLKVKLPTGVGAPGQPDVYQPMTVKLVSTASADKLAPIVSLSNPIGLSTPADTLLLRDIENAHFKLLNDITVPTGAGINSYSTIPFASTLDGGGYTLTTHTPLFNRIVGSRDNTVPVNGGPDSADNLERGYIYNLKVLINADFNNGVFGNLVGGTLKNVSASAAPSVKLKIDGPSHNQRGAFLNNIYGYSYLYGCFTDIKVDITDTTVGNIAGLIGYIDSPKATVESCGSNSDVYATTARTGVASLIGNISSDSQNVLIKNCFAAGLVQRGGYIAIGTKNKKDRVQNLYWSIKDENTANQATVLPMNPATTDSADSHQKWSFTEATGYVSAGTSYVNLPAHEELVILSASGVGDFNLSIETANTIVIGTPSFAAHNLKVPLSRHALAPDEIHTRLIAVHPATGLVARLPIESGIGKDDDGYYLVYTPGDLKYLSDNQYLSPTTGYLTEGANFKIKLMDDIDMAGVPYKSLGRQYVNSFTHSSNLSFKGIFDGNGHTISNLSVEENADNMYRPALIARAENATIKDLTLENMSVTATNRYVGLVTAASKGSTFENIKIVDCELNSSFVDGSGRSNVGGISGVIGNDAVNTTYINDIEIENFDIVLSGSHATNAAGRVGGLLGGIENSPVEIENVSSYNLNIKTTGTAKAYEIGGLVGDVQASALAFKLRNVHLQGHETEGSEIMGDQHVGGLVGRSLAKARTVSGDINAFIYDASLSDYTVTNRYDGTISNSTFEKAATGGIAGVFAGAMGDDPDTPAEEGLLISDCTITGNAAGGVLGKNDETYDNRYISITKVLVRGNTAVNNLNYDTADIANASAAGIAAVLSNEHQNSRVQVKNAIIQETVAINGIHYAAGIVAYTYGRVGSNYPDLEINFLNCQTFATITAHRLTVSNAGGIIGQHNGRFTRTKIRDCVIGGTISATNSAAGVIGVLNEIAAISTQLTAPVFKDTYVTASINSTGSYVAKIFGQVMQSGPTLTQLKDNIHLVSSIVVFSSHPQNILAYGSSTVMGAPTVRQSFADFNHPDRNNHTFYIHGTDQYVHLQPSNNWEEVVGIGIWNGTKYLMPYDFAPFDSANLDFWFDYDSGRDGWESENDAYVEVISGGEYQVLVGAMANTSGTGVFAHYYSSKLNLYTTDGAPEHLRFTARVPVKADNVAFHWSGNGTVGNPFKIISKDHLYNIRSNMYKHKDAQGNEVEEYFGGHYQLMLDLEFTADDFAPTGNFYNEGRLFEPIVGPNGELFSGIIDGGGHTIKGLKIRASGTDDDKKYVGLFSETELYAFDYIQYEGTPDEEEIHVESRPAFKNITFENLEVLGDSAKTHHVGGIVGRAEDTDFDGVKLKGATVKNAILSAGGLAGYADGSTAKNCQVINSQIATNNTRNNDISHAGGIAGRFSGTIGDTASAPGAYDIVVKNTNVTGNYGAGGIVGLAGRIGSSDLKAPANHEVPLVLSHAKVEGGKIEALRDETIRYHYGAGGLLGAGRFENTDTVTIDILYSKVDGPQIIGGAVAGGALGMAGAEVHTGKGTASAVNDVKITIDTVWVNADIRSAEPDGALPGKPSAAGGLVGHVRNAQLLKIRNVATAGEVRSSLNLGGLLGYGENNGTLNSTFTNEPKQSMVINAVIGTKIIPTRSTNMYFGLLMGDASGILTSATPFAYDPFVNIKFSSFVYPMGGAHSNSPTANRPAGNNVTGDSTTHGYTVLTNQIKDLNKGLYEGDFDETYAGLLFHTGAQTVNTLILGNDAIELNMEKPIIPGSYSIKATGDYTDFEDQAGLKFKLKEIFTLDGNKNPKSLAQPSYDSLSGKWSVEIDQDGIGYLVFRYENGLDLAINLIAFDDLEGDGSQGNPYKISRTGHFELLRYMTTAYFEQVNDISFTAAEYAPGGNFYNGGALFIPIKGYAANVYFTGSYNGGGYTINNLKVKQDANADTGAGLFAKLKGPINRARIINLTLTNVNIEGGKYVGGIVGRVDTDQTGTSPAPIQNCHVMGGRVESLNFGTGGRAEAFVGGIAGSVKTASNISQDNRITDREINDCSVRGLTVTASHTGNYARNEAKYAGGIAGEATYVINCNVDSSVITAGEGAGGLIGRLFEHSATNKITGRITNSHVTQDYGSTSIKRTVKNISSKKGGVGGLLGVHNANTDFKISGSSVDSGVTVESPESDYSGVAGGLVGNFYGENRLKQKLVIEQSVSQAYVKAKVEAGGILGTVKATGDENLAGSKLTIKDCVGALKIESTGYSTDPGSDLAKRMSAGGIIGTVLSGDNGFPFKLPGSNTQEMIVNCIAGGELTTHTNNPNKGKLIGNLGDGFVGLNGWTYASKPNLFKNNIYSSFPQDLPLFGGPNIGSLNYDQGILAGLVATNIAYYKDGDDDVESFMVQNTVDGVPQGDEARPLAMAPFDANNISTTHFISTVKVKTSDGSIKDLVKNYPLNLTQYHQINIEGMRLDKAQNTDFDFNFDGSGQYRELRFEITPHQNASGYVLVELSYGLAVAVPMVAFHINGNGTPSAPFEIEIPLHLSLLYYLTDVHYKQMNDLTLNPDHFKKNAYYDPIKDEYRDGELYWNIPNLVGFRPVGSQANPFTGTYDGQNHKITGFYSVYRSSDYVGMFGYIAGQAQLKNIHLELAENTGATGNENERGVYGKEFVGGLVGYSMSSEPIVNCSVAGSQVVGQWKVGGLVGGGRSSLDGCFTVTDVFAYASTGLRGYSGGLYGQLENTTTGQLYIKNSFAAGNIYSTREKAGGFVGHVPTNNGGILVQDSFFTGSVSSEYGSANRAILFGQGGIGTFGTITANRLIIAAPNIDYIKDTMPVVATGTTLNATNVYFDNFLLGSEQTGLVGQTASTTADLTGEDLPAGFSGPTWTAQEGSYPRLKMKDNYSDAYCALATVPILVDEKDTQMDNGMFYTPAVPKAVDGQNITFSASVLDTSDTYTYHAGYDPNLYGNGSDRQVDILFKDEGDKVLIYRNIFKGEKYPTGGTLYVANLNNHRFFYKCNNPILTMQAQLTKGSETVSAKRQIFLPFRKAEGGNFFIATERQLRALSTASPDRQAPNTKFTYFADAINSDMAKVWMSADIDLRMADFEPISDFKGVFKGNSFTVKNMKINKPADNKVGMFKSLESTTGAGYIELHDIFLENVQVEGLKEVGALVGYAKGTSLHGARIFGCSVFGDEDSYVKGKETVGGLIGKIEGGAIDNQARSAVNVSGYNVVGGLVGYSTADIQNSFFTGEVTAQIEHFGGSADSGAGIGGLIGFMNGGSVRYCFSSGDVSVTEATLRDNTPRYYGVGGFVGKIDNSSGFQDSFSSGLVEVIDVGNIKNQSGTLITVFGVGGFAGISRSQLTLVYSSSAVSAVFSGQVIGASGNLVAAGVGGVVGVALHQVTDSYSSGSVLRNVLQPQTHNAYTYFMDDPATGNIDESAIGGVIGTNANSSHTGHVHLYYDKWNNSIANLLVVGGVADTSNIKSLTTPELTISHAERVTPGNPLTLSDNLWSFNKGAYPAINELIDPNVSPLILYPAVLSIVALTPDERDESAFAGQGISMALTTTDEIEVLGVTYPLVWKAAEDSPVAFILQDFAGGKKFIPVRTSNRSQFLNLTVHVEDKEEFGSRTFGRACAEMLGTAEKPYLVSHKMDLQHIGLSPAENAALSDDFKDFYKTWYSPLNNLFENVEGKVHFRLLADIDMKLDVHFALDGFGQLRATVDKLGDGDRTNDNHHIENIANAQYGSIDYKGISLDGRDYSINDFKSDRVFFESISSLSDYRDVAFNNLDIDTRGTLEENNGTALVRDNNGTIDGIMVRSGSVKGGNNVSALITNNYGNLANSTVAANIEGKQYVGGLVAKNWAGATIETSAYASGTVISTQDAGEDAIAGGLVGQNAGEIENSFGLGSVNAQEGANVVGGLVGENTATGAIESAHTRTNVRGGDLVGSFAGRNAGTIKYAYSAGRVKPTALNEQEGIFVGKNTNGAGLMGTFADKNLAGSDTHGVLDYASLTEDVIDLNCFHVNCPTKQKFITSNGDRAYPQLKAILELDDTYVADNKYIPLKYRLLIAYSKLGSATIIAKYSQYVDTLALSTANPLSAFSTSEAYLSDLSWQTSNSAVISNTGTTGPTAGTATLTAKLVLDLGDGLFENLLLPIGVETGKQNPNFAGGDGSATNPYQIDSVESFNSLAFYGPGKENNYVLNNNLDYGDHINNVGTAPPKPIETFMGKLDGGNHVISDLTIDNNAALFGYVGQGAVIENIGLLGAVNNTADIMPADEDDPDAKTYTALLVGRAEGAQIRNSYAVGEIESDADFVGGLVAYAGPGTTLESVITSGKFVSTNDDEEAATGGIAGVLEGALASMEDSFSTAYVQGENGTSIGGLVGVLDNSATINESVYAGMVVDENLADGGRRPDGDTKIGNIAGVVNGGAAVTDSAFDKQISLVPDAHAAAKFSAELSSGWLYSTGFDDQGASDEFITGLEFATTVIDYSLGSSAGSTASFLELSFPRRINGNKDLGFVEIPQNSPTNTYLTQISSNPFTYLLEGPVDPADIYAGVVISLEDTGRENQPYRYARPRINRVIEISYTLQNDTGETGMDSKDVIVSVKNVHYFGGKPANFGADIFTRANATPTLIDDAVVSTGGIFALGALPAGYKLMVTAQDADTNEYLLGSATEKVEVKETEDGYGAFVELDTDTEKVVIHYYIVKDEPWGVYKMWSSLVDALKN